MNIDDCNKESLIFFKTLTKCYDNHNTNDGYIDRYRCIKNVYNKYIHLKTLCPK